MKRLFTAAALLSVLSAQSTNYYVSASGNDANAGTSIAAPWKTITKVNSVTTFAAGDSILFKRGESFYGKLVPGKSGTSALPIIFSAYGTGAKPVITAMTDVTGWVSMGGNLWKSTAITGVKNTLDVVSVNGVVVGMGRYPNLTDAGKGYLYFEAVSGKTGITDNQLAASPSWTGAEIVFKPNPWTIGIHPITAHSGTALTFSGNTQSIRNNYGYFIKNHLSTLDQQNEWFLDKTTKELIMYSTAMPTGVKASTIDTLCYVSSKNYIKFKDLEFVGANAEGISLSVTTGVTIDGCFVHFAGSNAIRARASVSPTVINSTLWDNSNAAIAFDDSGNSNAVIKGNSINRTGVIPGKGEDLYGITIVGSGHLVEANTIDSTGFNPIYFAYGSNITIKNNVINTYCFTKSDGGGIYTWNNTASPVTYTNRKVIGNIVLNGIGATEGTPGSTPDVDGIYMDDNTGNVEVLDNTVANVAGAGMYIHNNFNMNIQRNTLFGNKREQLNFTHNLAYINGALASYTTPLRNITFKNNVLVSKLATQTVFTHYSIRNDIDSTGTTDSNYYARPVDDILTIDATRTVSGSAVNGDYTLPSWKIAFKKDNASKKSPLAIAPYTISGFATANLITNGQFTSNISNMSVYSPNGNHTLTWDNTGKINGGSLKLGSPSVVDDTYTSLYTSVGSVSSTKTYILRFSTLGTVDTGTVRVYLRKTASPYSGLTGLTSKFFGKTKMDHEFLFTAPTTDAAASILIEFKQNSGTVYIDNIEFYEANIATTNIDDNMRLVYNPTSTTQTYGLAYKYLSIDSVEYNGTITLAPFTSKVLLKKGPITGTLPVKLLGFGAAESKGKVQVQWQTTSEVNSSHYVIQRSNNGRDFSDIGKVTSQNSINSQSEYNFVDMLPVKGTSYYRLLMVDKDGAIEYSKIATIKIQLANSISVENLTLSSANANVKFTLYSSEKQPVNVAVLDGAGRTLVNTRIAAEHGANTVERKIPGVGTGIYYVKVYAANGESFTKSVLSR